MTGVSHVFPRAAAPVWGFLTRYDEELMEPLVQCQVSQVSMRVARGSAETCPPQPHPVPQLPWGNVANMGIKDLKDGETPRRVSGT